MQPPGPQVSFHWSIHLLKYKEVAKNLLYHFPSQKCCLSLFPSFPFSFSGHLSCLSRLDTRGKFWDLHSIPRWCLKPPHPNGRPRCPLHTPACLVSGPFLPPFKSSQVNKGGQKRKHQNQSGSWVSGRNWLPCLWASTRVTSHGRIIVFQNRIRIIIFFMFFVLPGLYLSTHLTDKTLWGIKECDMPLFLSSWPCWRQGKEGIRRERQGCSTKLGGDEVHVGARRRDSRVTAGLERGCPRKTGLGCLEDWVSFNKPLGREGVPVSRDDSFPGPGSSQTS